MDIKDTNKEDKKEVKDEKYIRVLMRRSTHKVLVSISKKFDIPNIDLLDNTLLFLHKSGFDPKEIDVTSPAAEVKKLRSTVISFMKTQEKEILFPMVNKLDGAVSILVEFLKEANPSLIKRESQNVVFPVKDSEQVGTTGKFKIPTSLKTNEVVPEITQPSQDKIVESDKLIKENFNLQVSIEKKDKEIKRLKELINSFSNKITPKSFGSGYSIEITKEEIDELKSI